MRSREPSSAWRLWPLVALACGTGWAGYAVHRLVTAPAPAALVKLVARNAAPAAASESAATPIATQPVRAIETPPAIAAAGQTEICGYGNVALAQNDPYALQGVPAQLREAALDAADARMLASADARVRASALLIGARSRGNGLARIDQLVRLAVASSDPAIYAIAIEGCKGGAVEGYAACSLLSRAQWVRLDPDNARPWLELAAEAARQKDGAAEDQAMSRAAFARHSDDYAGLLPSLVDRGLGAGASALQRTLMLSASWGVQAGWVALHSAQAYEYCAGDSSPARHDTCDALAQTLAYRSSSLRDLGVGIAIGRALGWDGARLADLQREYDAIAEASGFQAVGVDLSCEAVDRVQDWMHQLAASGELVAMREVLSRSGRSIEAWSEQHRRSYEAAVAAVQAASQAESAQAQDLAKSAP
ncbi:MAG TPA: hypothetical protein VN680_12870 [Burkholderiaceae bacterium]|nr:hypothetical protein [Burkholderiaceae bacterium]